MSSGLLDRGAYGETTCIELVQPLQPDDHSQPIARRLAEVGEGVFHLAFRADGASLTRRHLDTLSVPHVDLGPAGHETHPRTVIRPGSANGVLIEILADGE